MVSNILPLMCISIPTHWEIDKLVGKQVRIVCFWLACGLNKVGKETCGEIQTRDLLLNEALILYANFEYIFFISSWKLYNMSITYYIQGESFSVSGERIQCNRVPSTSLLLLYFRDLNAQKQLKIRANHIKILYLNE